MNRKLAPHVIEMMNSHTKVDKKPEAVIFAEWLGINLMLRLDDGKWCSESNILETYTIEELYEKFEKNKSKLTEPQWENLSNEDSLIAWWD